MNWTKKINIFILIIFLILFNEITLEFFDPKPPLSKSAVLIIRLIDIFFIILFLFFGEKVIKKINKDVLIIIFISFLLLFSLNVVFVYFSPQIIKFLPQDIVREISPCYRTIFHNLNFPKNQNKKVEVVFGDSFSEGYGDEFLESDEEYGIFNKAIKHDKNIFIFGRGGHGSIFTVLEYKRCSYLLEKFTSLEDFKKNIDGVTFVFYEGNDLNNNLREIKKKPNNLIYYTRFYLPIFDYGRAKIYSLILNLKNNIKNENNNFKNSKNTISPYPISNSGISLKIFPQAAALELSQKEFNLSIAALESSIYEIKRLIPNTKDFKILYIPSVASSYEFEGVLKTQSYKNKEFYITTGDKNKKSSIKLRKIVAEIAQDHGWKFCDSTSDLISITKMGQAVHGPKDWKHLNKIGYKVVFENYKNC